jgi:two-component system cell cycle sensor histidine kinase/response regulator CckA
MPSELIMVVDDNTDLRELYADSLKSEGFNVRAFSGTKEALNEITNVPRSYRLVISDVMMEYMNGATLASKIKEINSDIKVILISGFDYSDMDLSHSHYDKFIQIPVTMSEFLSAVNYVLQMSTQVELRSGV